MKASDQEHVAERTAEGDDPEQALRRAAQRDECEAAWGDDEAEHEGEVEEGVAEGDAVAQLQADGGEDRDDDGGDPRQAQRSPSATAATGLGGPSGIPRALLPY